LKRNWKVELAGMSPVKKNGGTTVTSDDLISRDILRIKVLRRFRLRWKTFISTKSKASDFGYETPDDFLSLDPANIPEAFSVPILVKSRMPSILASGPFKERALMALAAGRLTYVRGSRIDEGPNLFNPFWRAELTAIASEAASKRLIPEFVLKEIQH